MTRRRLTTTLTVTAITVLLLAPTWARAADTLQATLSPAAVTFDTSFQWDHAEVSVSGPAGVTQWTIPADGALRIEAADLVAWARQAGVDADGQYRFEVRLAPALDATTRQALEHARATGDGTIVERLKASGVLPSEPVMASGDLRLVNGAIVVDSGPEQGQPRSAQPTEAVRGTGGDQAPAPDATTQGTQDAGTRDQVIADDLIVQGSECVGIDCVNNESFGFDTLRLKENNTRIKFDDTSNSGSFPTQDWQLTANDSANGGANKFSIDAIAPVANTPFTIIAGAPSNSIYVDGSGRLGLKTSTPAVDIHTKSGNTPTLRLEQDQSSGFAAQTWDVAGNETNFFVRDVTNGSKIPFKIIPNAPTNSLYVNGSGRIGLGTSSPSAQMHVRVPSGQAVGLEVEAIGSAGSDHASMHLTQSNGPTHSDWDIRANATTGALEVKEGGNSSLKFQKGAANNSIVVASAPAAGVVRVGIGTVSPQGNAGVNSLDVNGSIFQRGGQLHADYVFAPGYKLESIDDHAELMWSEKHLPAVPAGKIDAQGREVIEVGGQTRGILEELEKAHIYIEQLHQQVQQLSAASTAKDAAIEDLEARLDRLEAANKQ